MEVVTINVQIDVIRRSSNNIHPFNECHTFQTLKTQHLSRHIDLDWIQSNLTDA